LFSEVSPLNVKTIGSYWRIGQNSSWSSGACSWMVSHWLSTLYSTLFHLSHTEVKLLLRIQFASCFVHLCL